MSLSDLLLGPREQRLWRVRIGMTLQTTGIYLLFAMLQHAEVLLGFIDPWASAWLTLYYLGGSLVFYALVRSHLSERLSASDPALTFWQTLHGVLAMIGAYAITGPARGAVLAILVLVLAYGMFSLSVAQARVLAAIGFLALTLVMVWKSQVEPQRYPAAVELVHLAFGSIVLLGVSALSVRMGALRTRLGQQKLELQASLAQIERLATHDELTGLVNRRHMLALLHAEQQRQQRSSKAMSVVLLDLDHFKQINDGFGHQAGDAVLRAFAQSAGRSLRGTDILARWGGEEFLLLLAETDSQQALAVLQRLRAELAAVSFEAVTPGRQPTFSAGLAVCAPGETVDAVIERADQALYRAKQAGRNCTVCV